MDGKKGFARAFLKTLKEVLEPCRRVCLKRVKPASPEAPLRLSIGVFNGFEIAYRENTVDESAIRGILCKDLFFSGVPEYELKKDHVIIDVGAHIGTFSLLAASRAERGRVYAVEPGRDNFNLLRINTALNERKNISLHNTAMADRDGTCKLHHDARSDAHTTAKRVFDSHETVKCCTLSSFVKNNNIDKCHFMKLNCEGGEFPVLLSAPPGILRRFETMLVLYHCDLWAHNTEEDLISHLRAGGFRCRVRKRKRKRGWIIATRAADAAGA